MSRLVENNDEDITIFSLKDTVILIEEKYGENWRDWACCKMVVIWASKLFNEDDVKETVPDLFDLCMEYRQKDTVNGHPMPLSIDVLAFYIVDPATPKINLCQD